MIAMDAVTRQVQRRVVDGLPIYQFDWLDEWPVRHAVFTRHGGTSAPPFDSLNLSWVVGDDDDAVADNIRRVYSFFDATPRDAARVRMVHGTRVVTVGEESAGTRVPATDGLVTATPGLPLGMTFGDCQPILLYDPQEHVVGVGHAGWRGALAGIAHSLVQSMCSAYGSHPADIIAMLGPAIGECCYEVGQDVIDAARRWPSGHAWLRSGRPGHAYLDLTAANAAQLQRAGVRHVADSGLCTACRTDEFFSYRAEKPATGRFGVIVMLE